PYSADPTGVVDATAAIQSAMNDHDGDILTRTILYFPAGTYRLTDTLTLDTHDAVNGGSGRGIIFRGEGRDLVTLKLDNSASGFGNPVSPKVLVDFNEANDIGGWNNVAFMVHIRDLTIDVGSGNPGAIGLDFCASNTGGLMDVLVRSSDSGKTGKTGILLSTIPGPQLFKRVEVDGFDWGLETEGQPHYSTTIEFLTLKNCLSGGILNRKHSLAIRGLVTDSLGGPALYNQHADGFVTLLEAELADGPASSPAIDNNGFVYLRHITSTGYARALDDATVGPVPGANLSEWFTGPGEGLFDTTPFTSLHLPIEETPEPVPESPSSWVSVDSFGAATGDYSNDAPAIQAAINSMGPGQANEGKHTLYFPSVGRYDLDGGITIPAYVHRIVGTYSGIFPRNAAINTVPVFTIQGDGELLVIEELISLPSGPLRSTPFIQNTSNRDLVLRDLTCFAGQTYVNTGSGKLYLENVAGLSSRYWSNLPQPLPSAVPEFDLGGQDCWARQLDMEQKDLNLLNDGGDVWILGIKNEEDGTLLKTINGGRTELLGGVVMPLDVDDLTSPGFEVIDASASFVTAYHIGNGRTIYPVLIREERSGVAQTLAYDGTVYERSYTNGSGVRPAVLPLFSASVLTPAEHWRRNYFGTIANPGDAADAADPDLDGSINRLERAFGTDPTDPVSWTAPELSMIDITGSIYPALTFNRLVGGSGSTATYTAWGLDYSMEVSASLAPASWSSLDSDFVIEVAPVDLGDGLESVTIRSSQSISSGNPAFLRLKVD
ncbi:MAG: glycosyl hydrolase family 28-related protein, partial [Puniceicoccaceae bacterium]